MPKPDAQEDDLRPNCNCRGAVGGFRSLCQMLELFEISRPGVPRMDVLKYVECLGRNSSRRVSPRTGIGERAMCPGSQTRRSECISPTIAQRELAGGKGLVLKCSRHSDGTAVWTTTLYAGSPTRLALSYCAHETLPVLARSLAPKYTLKVHLTAR